LYLCALTAAVVPLAGTPLNKLWCAASVLRGFKKCAIFGASFRHRRHSKINGLGEQSVLSVSCVVQAVSDPP
jgi:hypothetical protein